MESSNIELNIIKQRLSTLFDIWNQIPLKDPLTEEQRFDVEDLLIENFNLQRYYISRMSDEDIIYEALFRLYMIPKESCALAKGMTEINRIFLQELAIKKYKVASHMVYNIKDEKLCQLILNLWKASILTGLNSFIDTGIMDKNNLLDIQSTLLVDYNIDTEDFETDEIVETLFEYYPHLKAEYEIFGTTLQRALSGWILNIPITYESPYTQTLINFIQNNLYNHYNLSFRKFTIDKAIYLIRWLGYPCMNFLYTLALGKLQQPSVNTCQGRWNFLNNFWVAKPVAFLMSYDTANEIIENDHTKYIVRMSTTNSGQLAIHFWDPSENRVRASLVGVTVDGSIILPFTKEQAKNIEDLDRLFREFYKNKFGLELPPILDKNIQKSYDNLVVEHEAEY